MPSLTRREILQWLACSGLSIGLLPAAWARTIPNAHLPLSERLSRIFINRESAREIGRRYLARVPEESDVGRLTALISRTPENYQRLTESSTGEIRALLAAQQRADFADAQTVIVDGWTLSRTEARLCGLAALD